MLGVPLRRVTRNYAKVLVEFGFSMMLALPRARHSEGESPSRLRVNSSLIPSRRIRVFALQPGSPLVELGEALVSASRRAARIALWIRA
jgi:hypothetical protein